MQRTPSIHEQLAALGYKVLYDRGRFHSALSMSETVYAQDQTGTQLAFGCKDGAVFVCEASEQTHQQFAYRVHRYQPVPEGSETVLVRAFRITGFVDWPQHEFDAAPSAACTLMCECGHTLNVNDAWAKVYTPKAGGWLLVKESGVAVYRSNESFKALSAHVKDNFYEVPFKGDLAL